MKEYTLIGHPVAKSLSPTIHNTAFKHNKLNCKYTLSDTVLEKLPLKINDIRSGKISGANVTIPYKCEVIKYVDELCPVAKKCGAVNTLFMKNNKLHGSSTDGQGAVAALKEKNINLTNRKIVVLGTGGAAKAVTAAITSHTKDIIIVGRNKLKIQEMVSLFEATGCFFDGEKTKKLVTSADIIINATSVGMFPNINISPIPDEWIHKEHTVFDLVYKPLQTKLLQIASTKNATVVDGLGMLIYQAIYAFEQWTGISPPPQIIRNVLKNVIR
ncbi:shikimate dehydrogenase [Candidatus Uabimicrobium sp. HlEnr_7]|uniref:shikimate dehydrogenase n=1 Tax=Candidatus Uabimicrobium helgolandensis TaxID=3095367 RepID=UPI003558F0B8